MDLSQSDTPQGPVLDMLWRQLHEINAVIDNTSISPTRLDYKIMEMEQDESVSEDLKEDNLNLVRLQGKLEELRDTMRRTINEAVRPFLRPLNILDLPDELLRYIFFHVRGDTTMLEFDVFDYSGGDVEQVKDLRLTCRRFCATSSHLLMFYVKVDLTPKSLAHLDRVSQHPTISKGIRAVKICLGGHFESEISHDTRAFARYQISKLAMSADIWEMNARGPFVYEEKPLDVFLKALDRAISITESFDEAAQNGLDESCPEHVMLGKAQECYRNHFKFQVFLHRGAFAQAIVSAMLRMPTATWLSIQDTRPMLGPDHKAGIIFPEDLEDLNTLQLKLQAPRFSWRMERNGGLSSPPVDLTPGILSSIGEAGIRLIGLNIDFPLPENLSLFSADQVKPFKLQASSNQLSAFTFRLRHAVLLSAKAVPLLKVFLSTILQTSSLRIIDLCFDSTYNDPSDSQSTISMATILFPQLWPSLEKLSFEGPFCCDDLRKLVNHVSSDVKLQWSGYLLDESWAEVLEVLRGCKLRSAITLSGVNRSISGAESEDMSSEELHFIFGEYTSRPRSMNEATRYIRGEATRNPVIDWENGDLDIFVHDSTDDWETESDAISDGET